MCDPTCGNSTALPAPSFDHSSELLYWLGRVGIGLFIASAALTACTKRRVLFSWWLAARSAVPVIEDHAGESANGSGESSYAPPMLAEVEGGCTVVVDGQRSLVPLLTAGDADCPVCWEREGGILQLPCQHYLCAVCSIKVHNKCPFCRAQFHAQVKSGK